MTEQSQPEYEVVIQRNRAVPARDGVRLAALGLTVFLVLTAAIAITIAWAGGVSAQTSGDAPGQIVARWLADGRAEFGWLPAGATEPVLPAARFLPPSLPVDRWLNSNPIIVEGTEIGRINARRLADGRIEFGFTDAGGARSLPAARFLSADAESDRWLALVEGDPPNDTDTTGAAPDTDTDSTSEEDPGDDAPESAPEPDGDTSGVSGEGTDSDGEKASVDADAAATASATVGRIVARRLADGRTEFGWLPAGVEEPIRPRARYFPTSATAERWLHSSPIEVNGIVIGRINARLSANGRIEFAFTPEGGERILPPARYFPRAPTVDRWLRSTEIEIGG